MPAPSRTTKTYTVVTAALDTKTAPVPANPKRLAVRIQNTGGSAGLARFGGPVQANGSDMLFAAGASEKWDQQGTFPLESLNFYSLGGTTWSVVEVVEGS